jgi:glycosyltransferase involved in cell wall biosynthesis
MTCSQQYPLFSVVCVTYNQSLYIKDTINSLLLQDYPNVEIIISDDCSTDDTYYIIKELVNNYSGNKKIIENRNETNLGANLNYIKAINIASGEYIISADGDDVSYPNRVSVIYEKLESLVSKPPLLISNALIFREGLIAEKTLISKDEREKLYTFESVIKFEVPMAGCTMAFKRCIFDDFQPIPDDVIAGDVVMYRRACLKGGIYYIPDVLVKYRQNSGGVSQLCGRFQSKFISHHLRWIGDRLTRFDLLLSDVEREKPELLDFTKASIENQKKHEILDRKILSAGLVSSTHSLISAIYLNRWKWSIFREDIRLYLIRWVPSLLGYNK